MSIFDTLGQMAGGAMSGQGGQAGGEGGMLSAVMQMVQNHPGGVGGLVQSFEQGGLGGAVQSWMSPGDNQSVSSGDVQQALGPDAVGQVAQNAGVSHEEAAGGIAAFLPQILGQLGGAGGQGGASGGLGGIMGMLGGMNKG